MKTNPKPLTTRPIAILRVVEGSAFRLRRAPQRTGKSGAVRSRMAGSADWNHSGMRAVEPIESRVLCAAKTFMEFPACSYAAQKKITKNEMMKSAVTRSHTSTVRGPAGGALHH